MPDEKNVDTDAKAARQENWILMLLIFGMLAAIIWFGWMAFKYNRTLDPVTIVLSFLIMKCGTLMDFKWGSSAGSKRNSKRLEDVLKTNSSTSTVNASNVDTLTIEKDNTKTDTIK